MKVRFWFMNRENDKRLIHIGYCRSDQAVCSRQDFIQISLYFCFVQDADRNQVARQGLFLILSENAPVIEGVVIVAECCRDATVQSALHQAAEALCNVPAHKIAVLQMK